MKGNYESVFAIIAALLVLFSAVISPTASVILSVVLFVGFAFYKYFSSKKEE